MTATTTKMTKFHNEDVIPQDAMFFDAGGSTYHTHTCPVGDTHKWLCNSPYCSSLKTMCPDHGGEEPLKIGREPWRK